MPSFPLRDFAGCLTPCALELLNMGIPGLASHLEPYATRYTSAELVGYTTIIDGPSLAYFAHRLAAQASSSHLPSYTDINAVAIRWLKNLENINIKV